MGAGSAETQRWKRFGDCAEFPIVLTAALSYEHYSDSLVAATMGRGVYVLRGAKDALLRARGREWVPEESSARFFPNQLP